MDRRGRVRGVWFSARGGSAWSFGGRAWGKSGGGGGGGGNTRTRAARALRVGTDEDTGLEGSRKYAFPPKGGRDMGRQAAFSAVNNFSPSCQAAQAGWRLDSEKIM